jgi:hypothetical protein
MLPEGPLGRASGSISTKQVLGVAQNQLHVALF